MANIEETPTEKKLVPVTEAAHILGIAKSAIYRLVKANRLKTVNLGKKILIPVTELDDFIDRELGDLG